MVIKNEKAQDQAGLRDDEIVAKVLSAKNGQKFEKLWNGDTTGYKSIHDAHRALLRLVTFYVSPKLTHEERCIQIDRLFRNSGMMTTKWDEKEGASTYGRQIVSSVVADQKQFYTPQRNQRSRSLGIEKAKEREVGLEKELADEITRSSSFARDAGLKPYRFENGAYRQDADFFVRQQVKKILERREETTKWKKSPAAEVIEYIVLGSPELCQFHQIIV